MTVITTDETKTYKEIAKQYSYLLQDNESVTVRTVFGERTFCKKDLVD